MQNRVWNLATRGGPPAGCCQECVRCAVRKISRDIVELARNVMPNWGVLVGALSLTCCTVTTAPTLYRVTELIPGISTKDDAIAKLGTPTGTLNAASDAAAAQSRIGSASESDAGSVRSTPLRKNPPRAVSAPSSNT
jgi:hypothetical protein